MCSAIVLKHVAIDLYGLDDDAQSQILGSIHMQALQWPSYLSMVNRHWGSGLSCMNQMLSKLVYASSRPYFLRLCHLRSS